jgi:hypothetical protein
MNEQIIWLGPAPALEPSAQVGEQDYARDARAECRAFIAAIRQVCGKEPEGARLVVQRHEHDAGFYFEVACVYDADDEWAAAYAARVDSGAPVSWKAAGMKSPLRRSNAR